MHERILEQHAEADVRLYVVWMPVLPLDEQFGVAKILVDPRARQFWDGEQRVNNVVGRTLGTDGLAWDLYALYGPEAAWKDELPPPAASGAPVVAEIDALENELARYLR